MDNQNFTVAIIDKNSNMFNTTPSGQLEKVASILEHDARLDEFSQESQFFIDETTYMSLGCQGVAFKYTKVFVENPDLFQNQRYCKFFPISEFPMLVRKYNEFDEHKPLFFMGAASFTKLAMKFSSRLLLTVVDCESDNAVEQFPTTAATEIFKGRRAIEPTLLAEIHKYKRELKRKRDQEFIITAGGAKILKDPSVPKYTEEVLNTANYMFYEFFR